MNKEAKETFELAIVYESELSNIITEVEDYGIMIGHPDIFYFIKNGHRGFVPKQNIVYFGRRDLYC